jgi:glutamine phosphoribosylpyrophosphate amidotransferase
MCVAILTKAGCRISEDALKRAFHNNGDGGGFAYIKDGKVEIAKGYMTEKAAQDKYAALIDEGFNVNPMLIHFRIATTGIVGRDNCHPFAVDRGQGKGAVIHNGTFYSGKYQAEKSDTRVLVERQRNNLTYEVVKAAVEDLGREIGSHNKMVFLYDNAEYVIVNESQGSWYDGVWISNHWFRPESPSGRYSGGNSNSRGLGASCGVRDC